MIVEDQDPGVRMLRAPEVRSGKAAEACAHDNQIIGVLKRLDRRGRQAIPERVRRFNRARVTPAQALQTGRVVAGQILRPRRFR